MTGEVEALGIEASSDALLRRSLVSAARNSPFWARRFAAVGFDANAEDAARDARALPLLDKPELLEDQSCHGVGGSLLAVPMSQVRRLHRTSGSTASPFIVMLTARDTDVAQDVGARALRCAGLRDDDLVVHCMNYSMWSGGVTDHLCFEKAGAAVIPFGIGNSRYLIETIRRLAPTAISCTPSYLLRLHELCRDEFGIEPRELGLRAAFLGGERGLQESAYRRQIESSWGMLAIDANYGLSEVLSVFASECEERCGLHFHGDGVLLPELVDERGEPVSIRAGATGELVLSTLSREAQPLFRYRTHDQIRIDGTSCSCGRSGFRFTVLGRTDDMIVVKGVNFFPAALRGLLSEISADVIRGYRVTRPRTPLEPVKVEVEAAVVSGDAAVDLVARIEQSVSERLNVKVVVNLVPVGMIPRTDEKSPIVV